jgi:hypothetical protein
VNGWKVTGYSLTDSVPRASEKVVGIALPLRRDGVYVGHAPVRDGIDKWERLLTELERADLVARHYGWQGYTFGSLTVWFYC